MLYAKIKRIIFRKQVLALIWLGLLIVMSRLSPIAAQTVTQGYQTDDTLQRGMLVMLKKDDTNKVASLTAANIEEMLGVVVDPNDAPVTISNGSQKVFVANTGHFAVLVSDQNGVINPSDYVTISAVQGIGMKADSTEAVVAGKALAGFNGKDDVLGKVKLKDSKGQEKTVSIGLVLTDINIGHNPQFKSQAQVPDALRKVSKSIANKDVGASRIYVGIVMLFLTSLVAGIILYAGVRSSVIALGRNPLSRKTILRSLFQVILTSVIIFICGLFGVYLLLKL